LLTNELGSEFRQSIVLTLGPPIVEGDVLTFNKAFFVESLANDRNERSVDVRRTAAEQSNHRKRTLLRARRERPRGRCAADKRG
jgi:2-succinyl-5-enolpyruvyl-6-hydroxy-3-cyclohexene-1-carboxylate synthase